MEINAQKKTHSSRLNALSTSTIIHEKPFNNKYKVHLSNNNYSSKPKKKDRHIFNEIKNSLNKCDVLELSLVELLEQVNQGYAFRNGLHAKPELNEKDYEVLREYRKEPIFNDKLNQLKNQKKPELQETTLAILDIDDVLGATDPLEVMERTGAMALYYSYNHDEMSPVDTKMNRYRLLYDLNNPVTSKAFLVHVQEYLKQEVLTLYPVLHKKDFKGKSNGIDILTNFAYGTTKGYEINENYKPVDVERLRNEYDTEQAFKKLSSNFKTRRNTNTNEQELIDMAHHLGDTQGQLDYNEFTTLAIGLFNTAQLENIPDETILEILKIIDAERMKEKEYLSFKQPINENNSMATVGTFIKLATDNGFKRKYRQAPSNESEQGLKMAVTTVNIAEYVDSKAFLSVLENRHTKNLVISDTNTGKTYASIQASTDYLKQDTNRFVYIALPTRSLAEQVATEYGLGQAIKGNINVRKEVENAIYSDTRLLVGTYDKAPIVYKYLLDKNVTIIADEVHKEVTDYSYRYRAINELFSLAERENVTNFIGLTGTPDDIDKTAYDYITQFKLETPKVLADTLQFIEYHNASHYELVTARIITQEVQQGNKVLAFINNKEIINKLAKVLKDKGLKVTTANAEQQDTSRTYKKLLKEQKIESDVVLSTIVLADGININNTKDYVCMIAPNHYKQAQFYNIDLIRQATNRFRNQYKKIVVPFYANFNVQQSKERQTDTPFNLDKQYNFLMDRAQVTKTLIETEFKDKLNLYKPSIAEHLSGLFNPIESENFNFVRAYENKERMTQGLNYDDTLQAELDELESKYLTIDKRAIRQQASKDKEKYYSFYPHAFKREITRILDVLSIESILAHEYMLDADNELKPMLDKLEKLKLNTDKEKREHLTEILHEIIYYKLKTDYLEKGTVNQSTNEWRLLKQKMNPLQYTALTSVITFLDYEQAIHELEYVKKKAQVYELEKSFNSFFDIESFTSTDKDTTTKLVFNEIQQVLSGGMYQKADIEELLETSAKAFKIRSRYTIAKRTTLFKSVFNRMFVRSDTKPKKVNNKAIRVSSYEPISIDYIARTRELNADNIYTQYINFIYAKKNVKKG